MKKPTYLFLVSFFAISALLVLLLPTWADNSDLLGHEGIRSASATTHLPPIGKAGKARLVSSYGKLPLSFEPNQGQASDVVKYLSRGSSYSLFLARDAAVLALRGSGGKSRPHDYRISHKGALRSSVPGARVFPGLLGSPAAILQKSQALKKRPASAQPTMTSALRMKLVGANPNVHVVGLDELPGKSNYFIGNDPTKWRTNIPNYTQVRYEKVYPGIDLVYYGNQQQLEYDFVIAPGSDPKAIELEIASTGGASPIRLAESGDLVIETGGGEVRFHKPVIYQPEVQESLTSGRQAIDGRYVLLAGDRVGFEVPKYDATRPLVIDPVLVYSSYLGGSSTEVAGNCAEIAVDSEGNAYVVSGTTSVDFPTTQGVFQPSYGGGPDPNDRWYACGDAFLAKVDPTGSSLLYSTYLGGTECESSNGIGVAVDSQGNAYVTGVTNSSDFPTTPGAFQTAFGGSHCDGQTECGDAFVTKVSPDGSQLVYSTFLGGSGNDRTDDTIAVDSEGNAYVGGNSNSTDFPTTDGAFQSNLAGDLSCNDANGNLEYCSDLFVAKLNSAGSSLMYSTFIGGDQPETANALAVDANGNAWVTGSTLSYGYPTTTGAYQAAFHPGGCGNGTQTWDCDDVVVTKLNADGSNLVYSTYLGSSGGETGVGLALDASGNAYVVGLTSSADFPTTDSAYQSAFASPSTLCGTEFNCETDAFVAKIDPSLSGPSSLVYSTYLGGSGIDWGTGIAVDSSGRAFVTGPTFSSNFPVTNQSGKGGPSDVFVTQLNAAGSDLIFSTYFGGSNSESADWLALDRAGRLYIVGWTESPNLPTTPGVFQPSFGGTRDMFLAKVDMRTFTAEVQPPIEANGSSVFSARRGVAPVKFTLAADGQPTCDLYPATIAVFRIGNEDPVPVNESEFTMPSDRGSMFRDAGCMFEYNLGTASLGPGKYAVQVWMGGVRVGEAFFSLK